MRTASQLLTELAEKTALLRRFFFARQKATDCLGAPVYESYSGRVGLPAKIRREKKSDRKNTYPPPADGLCVQKKCKHHVWCSQCSRPRRLWGCAGEHALHSVQGFAEKCHRLAQHARGRYQRGNSWKPRSAWLKNWKTGESGSFQNPHRSHRCAPSRSLPSPAKVLEAKRRKACSSIFKVLRFAQRRTSWTTLLRGC